MTSRAAALRELHDRILTCRRCPLWKVRHHAVPGEGPAEGTIMIVGEAPGRQEDAAGRPFVGAAGRVLEDLLVEAGLARGEIYITNVIKSHPTEVKGGANRAPRPEEIAACRPWLEAQLAIINPRVVITLGTHALQAFRPGAKISQVHGRPFTHEGRTIVPLYHPAVARYGARELLARDIQRVRQVVAGVGREP